MTRFKLGALAALALAGYSSTTSTTTTVTTSLDESQGADQGHIDGAQTADYQQRALN